MSPKHTPGPWETAVDGKGIFDVCTAGGGDMVVEVVPNDEAEANARLIAAAPELLEALDKLFEHCAMIHKHWGDGSNVREAQNAIDAARAAIAKAKGEE